MSKKFGEIELGGTFGGYDIINQPADKLPQDVTSAVGIVNSKPLLGATYVPIWYVGKQTVNGVNHFFIAEDIRTTKNKDKSIVGLVINIPPGEGSIRGEGANIVKIVESEELAEDVKIAFETATKALCGVGYKPVAYVGKKVVRGVNHYIICEAKGIYPNAQPYAAVLCINIFEGNTSIVGVAPINAANKDTEGLFGYAFTW